MADDGIWQNATDLLPIGNEPGHRDIMIISFNAWERRRYGEEFERRQGAIGDEQSVRLDDPGDDQFTNAGGRVRSARRPDRNPMGHQSRVDIGQRAGLRLPCALRRSRIAELLISEFVLFAPMVMPVVLASHSIRSRAERCAQALPRGQHRRRHDMRGPVHVLPMNSWTILARPGIVGTLDAVQQVARIVAIKRYFSPQEVRFTVPLTLTAQFIAGAIAGSIVASSRGRSPCRRCSTTIA